MMKDCSDLHCSDSNGYWRFKRLEDVLMDRSIDKLQVLTHPVWWQDEVSSPRARVHRSIDQRASNLKDRYHDRLAKFDRLNIG